MKKACVVRNVTILPVSVKLGYSSAEGALSIVFTIVYMIGMFYLTDIAALSPSVAGAILMTGTFCNAFFDPLVGLLSDRTISIWGRRRVFLLFSAIPYGITTVLFFADFNLASPLKEIYYLITIVLFFWFFSSINVPYSSLSSEIASSYDERTSLLGWRAAISQMGSLIGAGLPLILVSIFSMYLSSKTAAWSAMGACFGFLCVPLILITWWFTRGYEKYQNKNRFSLRELLSGISTNRSLIFTIGMYTFGLMAVTATGAISLYYMTYYLRLNETQSSLYLAIMFGGNTVWIPLIGIISKKLSKRHAYLIFGMIWALCQLLVYILINPGNNYLFLLLMIFGSSGLVAVFMIGWAMIPDCVDVDEYRTGKRREGLFYGIMFFTQKLCCALVIFLIGFLMSRIGYVANIPQKEETINVIRMITGPGIAFLICMSVIFCYLIPLTRSRYQLLCNVMAQGFDDNSLIRKELNKL
jgi:GPH family glycoside/pentoside/hexuronide:cation symporter